MKKFLIHTLLAIPAYIVLARLLALSWHSIALVMLGYLMCLTIGVPTLIP